jgi:nicotinamidase-related amidase
MNKIIIAAAAALALFGVGVSAFGGGDVFNAGGGGGGSVSATTKMTPDSVAFMFVDHQDNTVAWIQSQNPKVVVNNIRMLNRLAYELKIPAIITSTMEKTMGPNIKDLQETNPDAFSRIIKRGGSLDAFADPALVSAVAATGRRTLIISGLTTDICLLHTTLHAIKLGYDIFVVADGSGASSVLADEVTFDRLRSLGVVVGTANSALTELYNDFGTPDGIKAMTINLEETTMRPV